MDKLCFTITLEPKTKKNSMRIVYRGKYPRVIPSESFADYAKKCNEFFIGLVPSLKKEGWHLPLSGFYNISAVYYVGSRRRVDVNNLHNALHDILVSVGIIEDDDCLHVGSTDGSYVAYDKNNPRTEIEITRCKYPPAWKKEDLNGKRI